MTAILTAEQKERLRQIALQLRGPAAFRETEVVSALKLTADQRERIRAIEAELSVDRREGPPRGPEFGSRLGPDSRRGPGPRGFGSEEMRKAYEEKRRTANERIQAVLTEQQRKRWRSMTGEPFTGPGFLPGYFRPFGPRGGGSGSSLP